MRPHRLATLAMLLASVVAQAQTSASVRQEGDAILFDGRIDGPSVREFQRLLTGPSVRRLVIRSQGGLVGAALDMAEAVHARGLDVEVDQACLSSCANYIFPAARNKVLSGPAAVGWHGNITHVVYRQQRGEEQWPAQQMAQARELARREAAFFQRIGVDGYVCWFGKIAPYSAPDFYALSPADMAGFGIRDVTVRDAATPAPTDVRMIEADWAALASGRPHVPLEP
jgi:hypothetical protein